MLGTSNSNSKAQPLDKRERVEPPPRPQIPFIVWVLLAFLLGASLMYVRLNTLYLEAEEVSVGYYSMQVRARADPRAGRFGVTGDVLVLDGEHQGKRIELRYGQIDDVLELGQVARVAGIVQPIPLLERQEHRFARGLSATLTLQSVDDIYYQDGLLGWLWQLRARMQENLRDVADDQSHQAVGLMAGMTFGDRRELRETPLESALQRTGLAHFLAVSGTHLGLLGALLFFVLSKTALPRLACGSITLSVCACYVFLTGFAPGSIRACVMLALALLVYVLRRRVCVMSSLGLAGLCMLILDPLLAVSLGFLLSFGSVAAIVVFSRYFQQWTTCLLPLKFRYRAKGLTGGFALSLVAATATLPLTLEAFGILPIVGPLANLVFGPLLCIMLALSLVANVVALVVPPLGAALLELCLSFSQLLGTAISIVANHPWASVPMGGFSTFALCVFIACITGLWLWWPSPSRQSLLRLLAASFCVAIVFGSLSYVGAEHAISKAGTRTVTVLDVGQGDALLVRDGGYTVLVDAGPSPAVLRDQLREQQVRSIDILIFTHDHADHARGAQTLDASYGVEMIVVACGAQYSPVYADIAQRVNAPVVTALAGDVIAMEDLEIRFIWPYQSVLCASENDTSLTKLIVDTSSTHLYGSPLDIVFSSGDAEAHVMKRAMQRPETQEALMINGQLQAVDVLLIPHHGSRNSLDRTFIEMLIWGIDATGQSIDEKNRGAVAIFSAGAGNQFNHPRPEPLELVEEYFEKMYRTDLDGSVTIEL